MYEHGLVVGKFAPLHRGHQLLVETALAACRRLTVLVYATPDFVDMPNEMRAGWVRQLYPTCNVHIPLNPPPDAAPDAIQREFVRQYLAHNGLNVDVVLTSEAYGPGFARVLGVDHISVDIDRTRLAISGSALRSDPSLWRDWVHPIVYQDIGPLPDIVKRFDFG